MYRDITEGCKGLLVTTAKVLETTGLSYVIAGGWVPLLVEPNHPTLGSKPNQSIDNVTDAARVWSLVGDGRCMCLKALA